MELQSLGYVGIRARDLEEWTSFGTNFLGMQLVDRSRSTLTFRMDDRRQRVVVHGDGGEGAAFMGWEVADREALDALAGRLEAIGVRVDRLARAVADERRVRECIRFVDPVGNVLEAFYGAEIATDPFIPGRAISGFRTGPLGMGHVVMNVERIDRGPPVLSGRPWLPAQRLHPETVQGLLFPPQSTSSQLCGDRNRAQQRSPSHGRTVHARRRGTGLRSGSGRVQPDCDDARTTFKRPDDLLLCSNALGIFRRIRLGRAID